MDAYLLSPEALEDLIKHEFHLGTRTGEDARAYINC